MLADRPLIIVCDGKGVTHLFADGKVYGDGIRCISFKHEGAKYPNKTDVSVEITADDVNIIGKDEIDDILDFRMMIDRIIKSDGEGGGIK